MRVSAPLIVSPFSLRDLREAIQGEGPHDDIITLKANPQSFANIPTSLSIVISFVIMVYTI
jgi:hypothetical protein